MGRFLRFLLLFMGFSFAAQSQQISGKISSAEDGLPLPGATVAIKNTSKGTTADENGNYTLTAEAGATLVFSYIGFEKRELVLKNKSVYNIALMPSAGLLKDVVVVAYGTVKRATSRALSLRSLRKI